MAAPGGGMPYGPYRLGNGLLAAAAAAMAACACIMPYGS